MFNKYKMNESMKKLLNSNECDNINLIKTSDIAELLSPNIVEILGCIVIDNDKELSEDMITQSYKERIKKDKTGYEASVNEILLNHYIVNEPVNVGELVRFGMTVIDFWSKKLSVMYEDDKFIFICQINSGNCTLRFHKIRNNEPLWIMTQNLEDYKDEAIMYAIA